MILPLSPEAVTGDATGLPLPPHGAALEAAGASWLTDAFRSFGLLGANNSVTAITRAEAFSGGNSGTKQLLSVRYAHPGPGLPEALFVKFSRDFNDPFRDRRAHELAAEVRLATLSRHPAFPVPVPKACFADFHAASCTGLIISARVPFGEGAVLPLRPKCMDHLLPDAAGHYRALVTALASLAAAHQSGRLSPEAERLFPFDPVAAAADMPITGGEPSLARRLATYAEFTQGCARLLPAAITTPEFIARLERDCLLFLRHERAIRAFLHTDARFIALAHWNTHIDNAWFWHEPGGTLGCGLIDWGMVRQMNLGYALWGCVSGMEPDVLLTQIDPLLVRFAQELEARGGARLEPAELRLHFDLSVMLLFLALMIDGPALVLARLPAARVASGPHDPVLRGDAVAHGFLHVLINCLTLWQSRDFGASLATMLERA